MAHSHRWKFRYFLQLWLSILIIIIIPLEGSVVDLNNNHSLFDAETRSPYITGNRTVSWWDASYDGCGKGSTLYIQTSNSSDSVLLQQITDSQYYWIGALTYASWIWSDLSQYYTYLGYRKTTARIKSTVLEGISIAKCHRSCGQDCRYFGLSGRLCYCLKAREIKRNKLLRAGSVLEVPCIGNYMDKCGNKDADQMSIYVLNHNVINVDDDEDAKGECVYALSNTINFLRPKITFRRSLCTDERMFLCMEVTKGKSCPASEVCATDVLKTWHSANQSCVMLTHIDAATKSLKKVVKHKWIINNEKTYWIGLKQILFSKWKNGRAIYKAANQSSCLSMSRIQGEAHFIWKSCDQLLQPICQVGLAIPEMITQQTTHMNSNATDVTSSFIDLDLMPTKSTLTGRNVPGIWLFVGVPAGLLITIIIIVVLGCKIRKKRKKLTPALEMVANPASNHDLTSTTAVPSSDEMLHSEYNLVSPEGDNEYNRVSPEEDNEYNRLVHRPHNITTDTYDHMPNEVTRVENPASNHLTSTTTVPNSNGRLHTPAPQEEDNVYNMLLHHPHNVTNDTYDIPSVDNYDTMENSTTKSVCSTHDEETDADLGLINKPIDGIPQSKQEVLYNIPGGDRQTTNMQVPANAVALNESVRNQITGTDDDAGQTTGVQYEAIYVNTQ